MHRKQSGLRLTGQLGDVMQESANIAYSFVRSNADRFGVPDGYFDEAFLHVHVPAGATPKDGPSAGIAIACALISTSIGARPKARMAMTGELTLTGKVYPVGGIREKLLAAKRQKLRHVILPEANRRDYEEVPDHIRQGLQVHFVSVFDEVTELVF